MTKHIVGIIIFSFIVGTSAVIGSLFYTVPGPDSVSVTETDNYVYKKKKKRRCRRKKRRPRQELNGEATIKIQQAVFNQATRKLDTRILLEREDDSTEAVDVALHFFVSDKYSTRHLATEFISVSPQLFGATEKGQRFSNSFSWLTDLQTRENLYVMPEVVGDRNSYLKNPPTFNPFEATAILLNSGVGR
ncbi:MAG: hypothetical protein R2747_03025 [Pyrinomonadaceae bacterium]